MGQSPSDLPAASGVNKESDSLTHGRGPMLEPAQPSPDPNSILKSEISESRELCPDLDPKRTFIFDDRLSPEASRSESLSDTDVDLHSATETERHRDNISQDTTTLGMDASGSGRVEPEPAHGATGFSESDSTSAPEMPIQVVDLPMASVTAEEPIAADLASKPGVTETADHDWRDEKHPLSLSLGAGGRQPGEAGPLPRKKKLKPGRHQNRSHLRSQIKQRSQFEFSFTSLLENARALGLDIGSGSVKYVHLSRTARSVRLVGCGNVGYGEGQTEAEKDRQQDNIVTVIREKFGSKGFRNTLIETAISGMEVVFKNVHVPRMAKKELAKAVPWACRKDLPFPVESTRFEFVDLSDRKQGQGLELFVVAAQTSVVDNHLQMLNQARIHPEKIATIPHALWSVFQHCVKKHSEGCQAVVDIGANSSHIIVVNKGQLQFAREISTAGFDVTESLMSPLFVNGHEIRLSPKRAEALKRRHGIPQVAEFEETSDGVPLQDLSVLMVPVLERLVSDIQRTLDFAKEKFKVDAVQKVYLTGGGSLMPNLTDFMQRELNLEVQPLNPFDTISLGKMSGKEALYNIGPRLAVATGLALDRSKNLNMLPPALRGSHVLRYAKRMYKYAFILAVSAMVFLSQDVTREVSHLRHEFKELNAEYQASEPIRKNFQTAQTTYRQMQNLMAQYDSAVEINLAAATHLKVISHYMPRNLTLTSLRVVRRIGNEENGTDQPAESEFLVLDGVAFEDHSLEGLNVAIFLLQLEATGYFRSISLDQQKVLQDGSLQFAIKCETVPEPR